MTRFESTFLILILLMVILCGTQQTLGQEVPHGETIFIPDDKNLLLLEKYTTLSKEQIRSIIEPETKRLGTYLNGINTTFDADKTNAWYWLDAGLKYRYIKDNANALRCFNKGIEINPDIDLLYYNKSRVLLDTGQYDEAIMSLDNAIKVNPVNVNNYVRKLHALDRVDRPKEALKVADLVLERFPERHLTYLDRGTINLKLRYYSSARKDFDEYLKYDKKSEEAHLMKGVALYHLGLYMLAEWSFDEVIRINPQNKKGYENRLRLYKHASMDFYMKAMDVYNMAMDIPSYRRGEFPSQWSSGFKYSGDKALYYFRKYLAEFPDDDDNDMKLAFALLVLIDLESRDHFGFTLLDTKGYSCLDTKPSEWETASYYMRDAARSGDKKAQEYCKRFKLIW